MEDKRRRARVQGAWAGSAKSQAVAQPGGDESRLFSLLLQLPLLRAISARALVRPGRTRSIICQTNNLYLKNPSSKEGVYEISQSPTGISRLCLYPGFVDLREADWVLEQLCREVPWKQRTGIREDVTYQQPRLTAWYGELPYTYSRITMEPNPHWHPVLRTLKNQIEENTGHTFNSLLCNLYRNEKDSVDWHSDDEPSLGRCPVIASLSFGATRTFEMRKKPPPQLFVLVWHLKQISVAADLLKAVPVPHIVVLTISPCAEMEENGDYTYVERVKIPLDHGTLLIMEGATQADWQHRVPKEYHSRAQRINLTFRTVYPDTRGAHQ
ncbi:alpha-ketoglutarate-dependent dioxygenase alkB homolog 3 isoform X2 [Myotis lucifugus]|uniref:alpha-ketoglutarate-dependent dioxygenase alkB homolog 3 isoform X2 n=1 Tax=Myotis lucifugus TaxID=59463 RepID=UPI000CCC52D2|nr:alpha-ketoglutarate-dependent dioxygenase alkB homolog 3 isoform X2 [Myotis lucifugus]